jgi:hypothetical protein
VAGGFVPEPFAEIWLPLQADEFSRDHTNYVKVAARLRPKVWFLAARRQSDAATMPFRKLYPFALGPWEGLSAESFSDVTVGDIRPSLRMLTGAVLFVLSSRAPTSPACCWRVDIDAAAKSLPERRSGRRAIAWSTSSSVFASTISKSSDRSWPCWRASRSSRPTYRLGGPHESILWTLCVRDECS